MRLRSSRGGTTIAALPFTVVPGRELSGPDDWERVFGRRAPLVVEVGFGKDPFLLDRALARPSDDHVGIERDPGRAAAFVGEIERRGLTNVRALPISAELALALCFEDGAVAELHAYFPDPWPKARHAGNRLVRPWFAREARRVLGATGRLLLATDDAPYAAQMREVLAPLFREADAAAGGSSTKFERLWRSKGREIQRLEFVTASVGSAAIERVPSESNRSKLGGRPPGTPLLTAARRADS